MFRMRGFLVLADLVARGSGLVADVRLDTRRILAKTPRNEAYRPGENTLSAQPPSGAGTGRSCRVALHRVVLAGLLGCAGSRFGGAGFSWVR